MNGINLEIKFDHTGAVGEELRRKLGQVVAKSTLDLEAEMKREIQSGEKTGEMYGEHQASAPDEAPANEYGALAGSIQSNTGMALSLLQGTVTIGEGEIALDLEMGTEDIEPRPFIAPAVLKIEESFQAAAEAIVRNLGNGN